MTLTFVKNILFFLLILVVTGCTQDRAEPAKEFERRFLCDAEEVNNEKWSFSEANNKNIWFQNIDARTNEKAFSGQYSALLSPEKPFAFTTTVDSILPDDYIQIKIWRNSEFNEGALVVDGGNGFYDASKAVLQKGKNGWEQLFLELFIPPDFQSGKLKIYAWNNGKGKVYFDDLEIIQYRNKTYPVYDSLPGLTLYTDTQNLQILAKKRLLAFENGVLENNEDDFANVILYDGKDFLNGSFRLKGDLVDHLKGNKWSFRFKLKSGTTWQNMVSFSVHNPIARDFLSEWLAHQMFMNEDVLTTRYGFVPIILNGKSLGIYAWEEHFEKQLIESKKRREGPILKFDESIFWERVLQTNIDKRNWDIDFFHAAKILPFKPGKTLGDSTLYPQFAEGHKLMQQYRDSSTPIDQIIDVEQLAKYYALVDLTRAYHGFTWHNQRFYYNSTTCLLEPIAFDGYTEDGVYQRIDEPLTGLLNPQKLAALTSEELMLFQVFTSKKFNLKYMEYLQKYSSQTFIDITKKRYQNKLDSLSTIIREEFPAYQFNFSALNENAQIIRGNIDKTQKNIEELGIEFKLLLNKREVKDYTNEVNKNLTPLLVHANYNKENGLGQIQNFHGAEIEVFGVKQKAQVQALEQAITVSPRNTTNFFFNTFIPDSIQFRANGLELTSEINKWPLFTGKSPRQYCLEAELNAFPLLSDTVLFDGKYTFNSDVILADSLFVIARPGTEINLTEGASFISFAPVFFEGTATNPVKVYSADHSAKGFNVIQAKGRSILKNVQFSGISNLKKGGWQTPSAVTFYESDVDIEHCIFAENSNCDDALNIVRSDFAVNSCSFENTFADAFDSDFCTGIVQHCTFKDIGNDAIDFSGSIVKITDCKMFDISDKAISGGENSQLEISNCSISGANIGVASKDLSVLNLNKITIEKTVYGIVAFVKKPEYGPAKITIDNLKIKNYVIFHKIETGSVLTLNGKSIHGNEKNLALKLYQ